MVNFNDPMYGTWSPQNNTAAQLPGILGASQQQGGGGVLGGGQPSIWRQLLDPQVALPMAAALIGGKNVQESLAGAVGQMGPGIAASRKRMAWNSWLKAKSSGDPQALKNATDELYAADPTVAESVGMASMVPHRQFTTIGQSVMGQPQYGWVDPVAGTVEPVAGSADAGAGGMGGLPGAKGGVYDSLPKAQQAQVDQLIDGKMAYPSGFQLAKSPYWNTITAAAEERAQALGVPLDANKYPTRLKTKEDFTSGKSAQTITAGNAAIGHLGQLDTAVDKLGNWNGVPFVNYAYNAAANAVANASGSATNLQTFNAIKSKYSQEITKFYRASGGSDSDISEAMGQLDAARSPDELHATIKAQVGLLESKIGAMQEQWHNGMGAKEPDFPLISKEAQGVLDRIAPSEAGGGGSGGGQVPTISDPAQAMKLPPGTRFMTPDGRMKIVPGAAPGAAPAGAPPVIPLPGQPGFKVYNQ